MELVTKTQFAKVVQVSLSAISKALKRGLLEVHANSKYIDIESNLSKAYINNINPTRLKNQMSCNYKSAGSTVTAGSTERYVPDNAAEISYNIEDYSRNKAICEAEKAKRISIQNKYLEKKYVEKDVMYDGAMLYFDQLHQNMNRFFSVVVDDIAPAILSHNCVTTDIIQKAIDAGHSIIDNGKKDFLRRVSRIIIEIENSK